MFILLLKYIKPVAEVEKELENHIKYLDKYYALGKFVCSGRRNPRIGGVILCKSQTEKEVKELLKEDPFYSKKIAEYEIIDFSPTKYAEGFEKYIDA
jgi:uncharacterized protein YciI